ALLAEHHGGKPVIIEVEDDGIWRGRRGQPIVRSRRAQRLRPSLLYLSGERAEKTVRDRRGNEHGLPFSDAFRARRHLHRLQIWGAPHDLDSMPAWLLEKHLERAPDPLRIECRL